MSLWTPSGEHPIGEERPTQPPSSPLREPPRPAPGSPGDRTGAPGEGGDGPAEAPDVEALRRQLADAPADVIVTNHCYGLFELAAVYLSDTPPHLEEAKLAIDALGFLVDGLGERLGESHATLRDALAQIRLAFVQISATREQPPMGNGVAAGAGTGAGAGGGADADAGADAGAGAGARSDTATSPEGEPPGDE